MENYPDKKAKHRSASLLLVDDNAELLSGLKLFLNPWFDSIDVIRNPNLIPSRIQSSRYDVILLDMNFTAEITSGNEGIYWLRQIIESEPDAVVVMITAYGDIELAVKAIKEGATDFISKSWDEEKILSTLISALKLSHSKKEIKKLKTQQKHLAIQENQGYSIFKSKARSMTGILRCIEKAGQAALLAITPVIYAITIGNENLVITRLNITIIWIFQVGYLNYYLHKPTRELSTILKSFSGTSLAAPPESKKEIFGIQVGKELKQKTAGRQ